MNSRQKLSSFLHPNTKSSKNRENNDSLSKTSFFSRKPPHILEILDCKAIFYDPKLSIRQKTFKTFIKSDEKSHIYSETSQKKRFFSELRQQTSQSNYQIFKKKHENMFKTTKKPGLMHSNELWSDRDYRRVLNDSGLKPKFDYMKLSKKIKLFHEIVQELSAKYRKSRENHKLFQKEDEIINSFRNYGNIMKKPKIFVEKPESSKEIIGFFQENSERTEKITSFHDSPEKMKELASQEIQRCDTNSRKSLEKVRVFRNKLLQSVLEKRHQRDSLKKISSSHHKSDTSKRKNSENKQKGNKIYDKNREKIKNYEVLKSCEDETKSNIVLKK